MAMTATTTARTPLPADKRRHVRVGILGVGFAGLGMAIRLSRQGVEDFVVWERDADVGATWWANGHPGCRCDIPSHLYSFVLRAEPGWRLPAPRSPRSRPTSAALRPTSRSGRRSA
jgi:cation diffusion facilitator CzcD-associated flavoprotein CzcO